MIRIYLRSKQKETALVQLLHGEAVTGRMFTSFPIKGMTRKVRVGKGKLYQVVNSRA